jgi:glutamate--cysteine ligase
LSKATSIPYLDYERIGTKVGGHYRQLNTNLLQIENEYYTSVRPKQLTRPNERPLRALSSRGIQYIEIRSLDIDIFEPTGISIETTRFLEVLSLLCLFHESPAHDLTQYDEVKRNGLAVANKGRDPALKLLNKGQEVPLRTWALMLCDEMQEICEVLDNGVENRPYTKALHKQMEIIRHPELTSSAKMLATMRDQKLSVAELVLQKSRQYTSQFQKTPVDTSVKRDFDLQVENSLQQLERMNNSGEIPFDRFLGNYFSTLAEPAAFPDVDRKANRVR